MEKLIFLISFIIIGFGIITLISKLIESKNSEVLSEKAYTKSKIDNRYVDSNGVLNRNLIIVFDIDNKEIKCVVKSEVFEKIPENVSGILTHKGTSFIKFKFDGKVIE